MAGRGNLMDYQCVVRLLRPPIRQSPLKAWRDFLQRTPEQEFNLTMHNPPHPGEILKTLCLEPLNLTVTDAAKALGISRKTLSGILNGRIRISPEMAVRLSIAFDTTAQSWMNQQAQYDLWQAEQHRSESKVNRLSAASILTSVRN